MVLFATDWINGQRITSRQLRTFSQAVCVRACRVDAPRLPADSITGASAFANSSPEYERVHCPGDKKSEKKGMKRKRRKKTRAKRKKKTEKSKEDREKSRSERERQSEKGFQRRRAEDLQPHPDTMEEKSHMDDCGRPACWQGSLIL